MVGDGWFQMANMQTIQLNAFGWYRTRFLPFNGELNDEEMWIHEHFFFLNRRMACGVPSYLSCKRQTHHRWRPGFSSSPMKDSLNTWWTWDWKIHARIHSTIFIICSNIVNPTKKKLDHVRSWLNSLVFSALDGPFLVNRRSIFWLKPWLSWLDYMIQSPWCINIHYIYIWCIMMYVYKKIRIYIYIYIYIYIHTSYIYIYLYIMYIYIYTIYILTHIHHTYIYIHVHIIYIIYAYTFYIYIYIIYMYIYIKFIYAYTSNWYMHIHYICIHHTYTYLYIPIHTYTYLYIPIHTYTYLYIPIHTCTYLYIPIHTYTYLYIHNIT